MTRTVIDERFLARYGADFPIGEIRERRSAEMARVFALQPISPVRIPRRLFPTFSRRITLRRSRKRILFFRIIPMNSRWLIFAVLLSWFTSIFMN